MDDSDHKVSTPPKTEAERRAARLAEQLRANLKRRKQQKKARTASGSTQDSQDD